MQVNCVALLVRVSAVRSLIKAEVTHFLGLMKLEEQFWYLYSMLLAATALLSMN